METISVHASRDYEVRIGSGLLTRTGELSAPLIKGRHAMIVSDSNVWPLYGSMVQASLEDAGFQVDHFVFPAGEQSKNTDTLVQLLTCLAQKGMTRSDGVFALGGGVTGDMAGLAASLYLRGIPCVQLPTSLLSVVDSSVGGKTAVDLPEGKNLVGTFTQPHLVLCDTNVLATLSPQVEAEGWAEIIKYGMIRSQELINFLLENTPGTDIEWVIAHCVSIKRDVVAQDEQDNAVRQVLNFGHTIGHAIERCGGYSIYHGEGVAMGMAIMTLRQEMVVTVNATIDYLSAAAAGSTLTTVGKVDRLGGKLAFCSAEMTDETGKVIVRAHCVMCFTGRALPL